MYLYKCDYYSGFIFSGKLHYYYIQFYRILYYLLINTFIDVESEKSVIRARAVNIARTTAVELPHNVCRSMANK